MRIFRRRTNKKSLGVLLLLIIVVGYFLFNNLHKASAEWFDQNWFYRQAVNITVTSSASDVSNLDTWFTMSTSALISANKLQSSCQDLRFTNANGKPLPYYIDSGCNTTTTKIWVKADLVPKNSTTYTMYVYYGNPSAPAGSDSTKFNLYNGLVGYWNMNESSWTVDCSTASVKDLSVNANNAKSCPNSTGSAGGATGKYGNGGGFDGNDYVENSSTSIGNFGTGAFSISAWVKTSVSAQQFIVGKITGAVSPGHYGWLLGIDGSYHAWLFSLAGGGTDKSANGTRTITDNNWHHVLGVREANGTLKVYVDGSLDGTTVVAAQNGDHTSIPLSFGGESTSLAVYVTSPLSGSMDEVRLYNRALSLAEVSQLYSDGTSSILTAVQGQSAPSVSFATEEKSPAPVAYFRFDEGQGQTAYDDSSNNNDGTLGATSGSEASDPTWQTGNMCVSGKCLKFDGTDDYVNAGGGSSFDFGTGSFTMSAWFRTASSGNPIAIVGQGLSGTYPIKLIYLSNGYLVTAIEDDAGHAVDSSLDGGQWNDNSWHFGAAVFDRSGNTITRYVDGKQIGTTTNISAITGSTDSVDNLYIGAYNGGASGRFPGFIDDVKVYPYARTAAQIRADFNSRNSTAGTSVKIGNESAYLSNGLVGYWKMNETSWSGAAGEVVDSSGNGNNGVRAGDATTAAGKFGNGGTFDGTGDNVQVTSTSQVDYTGNFTIGLWAYPNSFANPASNCGDQRSYLTSQTYSDAFHTIKIITTNASDFQFFVRDTTIKSVSTGALSASQWYHLVGVRSGNTITFYKNGTSVGTADITGLSLANISSNTFWMGAGDTFSCNNNNFNGYIDDLRLYNRALSSKEVTDLYNWAPGPVGYWGLDEKSGTTVINQGSCPNCNGTSAGITFTKGKYGGAYDNLPSISNYWYVPANTSLDVDSQFTVEAWATYDTSGRYGLFANNTAENQFNAVISGTTFQIMGTTLSGGTLTAGQWFHTAVTYTGSAYRLYINGTLVSTDLTTSARDFSGCWVFGQEVDGAGNCTTGFDANQSWDGKMDEMRIYNYARTQKQIAEDMNAGHPSVGSPVGSYAGYWKFDEGTGYRALSNTFSRSGTTTNMMTNPSFETGTTGWSLQDGGTGGAIVQDSTQSTVGTYSLKLTNGNGGYTNGNVGVTLSSSTAYTLSGWIKTSVAVNAHVLLCYYNGSWTCTPSSNHSGDGTWQKLSVTVTTGASVTSSVVKLEGSAAAGSIAYFDGIQLEQTSAATMYCDGSLLGNGSHAWTGTAHASTSTCDIGVDGDISGASWTNDGKFGKALVFDGTSKYVNIGDGTSLGLTDELTYSAWVKFSSFSDANPAIVSHYWRPVLWRYDTGGGVFRFTVDEGGGNAWNATGTTIVQLNQWYHVVGTFSKSEGLMKVYVNGKLEGQTSKTASINLPGQPATIGCVAVGCSSDRTNGIIDEVKIYPFALTQADIQAEYNRASALKMGSLSDTSGLTGGVVASDSASAIYCIPGDTASCNAPVGEWKMDEHTGNYVNDTSGNNNIGILGAGTAAYMPTWKSSSMCKLGSCLNFDGSNDYVNAGSATILDFGDNDFTVEGWFKRSGTGTENGQIISKYSASGPTIGRANYEIYWGDFGTNIFGARWTYSSLTGWRTLSSNTTTSTGVWYHFAFIHRSGWVYFYVNGVLTNSRDDSSYPIDSLTSTNFEIGRRSNGNQYFNGIIDEVRAFDYARTAAQVAWDYNRGKSVGWWKFDECQGVSVYDSSGNGNTGTVTIGATVPQSTAGTCTTPTDGTGAWYNGRSGRFNSALSFDGADDVVVLNGPVLTPSAITVGFWWKRSGAAGGSSTTYHHVLRYLAGASGSNANSFYIFSAGDRALFRLTIDSVIKDLTINNLNASEWNYVVGTWNGSTMRGYVNGVEAATPITVSGTLSTGTTALNIGRLSDYVVNGLIDDLKIYNYALTAQQIKMDYNQGSAVRFGPTTGRP